MKKGDRYKQIMAGLSGNMGAQTRLIGETLNDFCDAIALLNPRHPDVELVRDHFNRGIEIAARYLDRFSE
jgi:hypothetical protein